MKHAKMRGGISNHGRTIRTREGISNHGRTIRKRGSTSNHRRRTMGTGGGVKNCRTRDAAHTSHSELNETMDDNAGSNEQQNDIMDKFGNSSEQQYPSMDDANADKLNAGTNISENTAVDKDIGSNNKTNNDKTNNDTLSKDGPFIKTFLFGENTGVKIVAPENDNLFFYFKFLVSDEFLGEIVQSSNEYARRVIDFSCPLCCRSVLNKWKEVTLPEMKKFFG